MGFFGYGPRKKVTRLPGEIGSGHCRMNESFSLDG